MSVDPDRPRCADTIVIVDNDSSSSPKIPIAHAQKTRSKPEGNSIIYTLARIISNELSIEISPSSQARSWKTADDVMSEISNKSPSSEDDDSLDSGLNLFLREIGEHPDQLEARQAEKPLRCVVCKNLGSDGKRNAEDSLIQCSKCWYTSHRACIESQFGLPGPYSDDEATWKCPGRCNNSIPLWDDALYVLTPGPIIFWNSHLTFFL